ncbi:MAG: HD domain-containing protein [Lachnospiraceae bacterium]|nr:HD domain-containing protein [Lachnospiraceae bacterium]MBF0997581.1 HD domain-containing protein [Lachnospiraceae bacterium]MBF0999386.1 HD domain-containing protein [Lachnospiraceae bacterium]MBF1008748.1 HD domain-containing protein [Lachnospiraceae bacterium]MBF1013171.1 HD domain-containing protein [Lachnospiraceae bacterium]
MRYIDASQLRPGMQLADNLYSLGSGQMIMPRGTVLDDKLISRLEMYPTSRISIQEGLWEPTKEPASPDLPPSYAQRLRQTPEFQQFKSDFEETFSSFKWSINEIVKQDSDISDKKVSEMAEPVFHLITATTGPSHLFDMLHCLRQYDDETYAHSVNVALIAHSIGVWMNLPEEDLNVLTKAGLMHDIGKLMVPHNIISKPASLTSDEYNIIKEHTLHGYEILKDQNIDERIKLAVLEHHERCDGSGYPNHLVGKDIDPFAKVIALADVYDAVTSPRVYRDAQCPFIALSIIENEGMQKYDSSAYLSFMSNVVNIYLLNQVRLNDGRKGEIVFINREFFSKPTIRIGNEYIDLSLNPQLYIEELL